MPISSGLASRSRIRNRRTCVAHPGRGFQQLGTFSCHFGLHGGNGWSLYASQTQSAVTIAIPLKATTFALAMVGVLSRQLRVAQRSPVAMAAASGANDSEYAAPPTPIDPHLCLESTRGPSCGMREPLKTSPPLSLLSIHLPPPAGPHARLAVTTAGRASVALQGPETPPPSLKPENTGCEGVGGIPTPTYPVLVNPNDYLTRLHPREHLAARNVFFLPAALHHLTKAPQNVAKCQPKSNPRHLPCQHPIQSSPQHLTNQYFTYGLKLSQFEDKEYFNSPA